MKNFFLALMSDTGNLSMTRFLSLVCVLSACLITVVCLYRQQPVDSVVGVVSVFLGAAFTGKVAQSFAEKDNKAE
jgi:hypothetical protein